VLPTGAGKSMAFLVPALTSAGGALVVSLLRALMRAMVQALPESPTCSVS
jgi:superfamily II DNA helicase RecQ